MLNWGLGHATRSLPLIRKLTEEGSEVVIASDGRALEFLRREFPLLQALELPAYGVSYNSGNILYDAVKQYGRVNNAIGLEKKKLDEFLEKNPVELIISDNRYGIYHKKIKSVLMTHQLRLPMPRGFEFLSPLAQIFNRSYLSRFHKIWVPDYAGEDNLSGKLSHGVKAPVDMEFIGPLSRFKKREDEEKYDFAVVLSGPEPARTRFEQLIVSELTTYKGRAVLVRGTNQSAVNLKNPSVEFYDVLGSTQLETLIAGSRYVVCRSGYSSIMDLKAMRKKAVLVPTPGQPEQEYLAEYHSNKGNFPMVLQKKFSLKGLDKIIADFYRR